MEYTTETTSEREPVRYRFINGIPIVVEDEAPYPNLVEGIA